MDILQVLLSNIGYSNSDRNHEWYLDIVKCVSTGRKLLPTALASQILIVTITRYSLLVSSQSMFQLLNIFHPLWPNKNFLSVKHLSFVCWHFHKKKKKTYIALSSSLLRRHVIVVNFLLYGFFICEFKAH